MISPNNSTDVILTVLMNIFHSSEQPLQYCTDIPKGNDQKGKFGGMITNLCPFKLESIRFFMLIQFYVF